MMKHNRHPATLFAALMIALAPVAYASAVTNYTYDANGNMISDGRFYYVYDGLNHMTEAREGGPSGALAEKYWYDHAGRRVIKEEYTSNGTITTYYVNEYFEMAVYPDGTTANTSYIYANDERVAKEVTSVNGTEVYYYHSDHLGSTSVVTRKGRLVANTMPVNSNWTIVSLNESLMKPVVIARLMTENDEDNSVERINNVSSNSFKLRVEESPSYDGNHANETMGYIALEEGTITDGGADIGQAGEAEAGDVWTRVSFPNKFDVIPVVVASAITAQDGGSGTVRIRNIDITGFDVRFEEYPSQDGGHKLERLGWVALKPGAWTLDGKTLIAGTAASVTANYSSVTFPQNFTVTPVVLAQTLSYNEGDLASHTRQRNPSATGFEVKVEEETDTPRNAETIGYVAVEPATLRSGAAKVEETKYYPYGVVQEGGGEKYLYTGKERDKGTGLYYYGARYYNPHVGRFVQPDTLIPDPYNPQSLNRYSYALNNPLRYTDPSGHFAVTWGLGIVVLEIADKAITAVAVKEYASKIFIVENKHIRFNPSTTTEEKIEAAVGIIVAVGLEAADPTPFPIDDAIRRKVADKLITQKITKKEAEVVKKQVANIIIMHKAGDVASEEIGEAAKDVLCGDEGCDSESGAVIDRDNRDVPYRPCTLAICGGTLGSSGLSNEKSQQSSTASGGSRLDGHGGTWNGDIYTDRHGRQYEMTNGAMRQIK